MSEKEQREPKRRERLIDAGEVFVADGEEGDMNSTFRKRLTYLMNGNNIMEKPVNIQELADAVGVTRPAIRKYLKPKEHGEPTTPSAQTVCRIARFFGTTPNFLLGFDEPVGDSARIAHESEFYNRLGLNQRTIEKLRALREKRLEAGAEHAAALMSMLDRQICDFADDALAILGGKRAR